MYKVEVDGELLYHPNLREYSIEKTNLVLESLKTGNFKFVVRHLNPSYSKIKKMESIIEVFDDDEVIFSGRVLNAVRGMQNELQVTCEGRLAFLLDSIVRPYEFSGSVEEYFDFLISQHNSQLSPDTRKQFRVGRCTVTDPNNYIVRANKNYPKTFDEISEKLIGLLGGYILLRIEEDGFYIDYLEDIEEENDQEIKFGENLLDLEDLTKGQDIATAIIPLGAYLKDAEGNDTDVRLTIEELNGRDYVYDQEAVDKYGYIFKTVIFEDVTLVSNLKARAEDKLQEAIKMLRTLKITAVDLHLLDADIKKFRVDKYTKIKSKPHGLDERLLMRKIELNILNPSEGHIEIGAENQSFASMMSRPTNWRKNIQK